MSSYTVAIIGTGRVGAQFDFVPEHPDNHADAIAVSDSFTLVAGVNRGREKLDLFGERCGVDALYHDYRQMLDEVGPDVCIVATHPELHRTGSPRNPYTVFLRRKSRLTALNSPGFSRLWRWPPPSNSASL